MATKTGTKSQISFKIDASDVVKSFGGIRSDLLARGLGAALRKAVQPETSQLKMAVAKDYITVMKRKGVKDVQRGIKFKIKMYKRGKRGGTAVALIGLKTKHYVKSSHNRPGGTWWNKIIHLFEYGSKNSPEKLNTFEGFYNANKTQIEDRFKLHMMDSIQKAINRNRFLEKKGKGLKR